LRKIIVVIRIVPEYLEKQKKIPPEFSRIPRRREDRHSCLSLLPRENFRSPRSAGPSALAAEQLFISIHATLAGTRSMAAESMKEVAFEEKTLA
jgi:hypothetical protein